MGSKGTLGGMMLGSNRRSGKAVFAWFALCLLSVAGSLRAAPGVFDEWWLLPEFESVPNLVEARDWMDRAHRHVEMDRAFMRVNLMPCPKPEPRLMNGPFIGEFDFAAIEKVPLGQLESRYPLSPAEKGTIGRIVAQSAQAVTTLDHAWVHAAESWLRIRLANRLFQAEYLSLDTLDILSSKGTNGLMGDSGRGYCAGQHIRLRRDEQLSKAMQELGEHIDAMIRSTSKGPLRSNRR
jgi:hypothetical protein